MSTLYFNFSYCFENIHLTFETEKFIILGKGGQIMTAKQIITMAAAYCGISSSELARRLNMSPQLLNKRMNTGKFTPEEWERIGQAMGATARVVFTFPDGKEI